MKLGELTWEEYKKKVSGKVLRLARRIIKKEIEGLEKFLMSSESGALSEDSQNKLQKEVDDLYKIVGTLKKSSISISESLSLDISELGPESEAKIKQAISEAAKRLRPMDQKGILESLQPQKEESPKDRIPEKMPEDQCKILEILTELKSEIGKIRVSIEMIPREIREIRMLFSRIERMGGFK